MDTKTVSGLPMETRVDAVRRAALVELLGMSPGDRDTADMIVALTLAHLGLADVAAAWRNIATAPKGDADRA